jgi:cell division septation protein DedD
MNHVPTVYCSLALATLLAGCAHQTRPEASRAPTPVVAAAEPRPPAGAAKGLSLPSADAQGHYATINSGVGDKEAIWHFRAALNVAALSCTDQSIRDNYNQLLKGRKAVFASAYASETARLHGAALDQHQTRLYNFFAQPPAKIGFCRAADAEATQALSVSAAEFPAYAVSALQRLEAPMIAFYAAYDRYRHELADWKANPRKPAEVMTAAAVAKPAVAHKKAAAPVMTAAASPASVPARRKDSDSSNHWRVQIGAFSGQSAAEAAWKHARERVPDMASYKPSFEPVPGKPSMVRLQLTMANDRDGAQKLCATAAANGINCLPIAR